MPVYLAEVSSMWRHQVQNGDALKMNTPPPRNTSFSFTSYKGWFRVDISPKKLTNDWGSSKNDDQIISGSWFPIMIVFTEPCLSLAAAVSNVTCFSEPLPGDCAADRSLGSFTDSLGVRKYNTGETLLVTSQSPPDRSKIDLLLNRFLSNSFLSSAFPAKAKRVKNMTLSMIKTWGWNPAFSVEGNHWKKNFKTRSVCTQLKNTHVLITKMKSMCHIMGYILLFM